MANHTPTGKTGGSGRKPPVLLLVLLLLVALGGAYFYFQRGEQEPPPPAQKKQIKKIAPTPKITPPEPAQKKAEPQPEVSAQPAPKLAEKKAPEMPEPEPERLYVVKPGECLWEIAGLAEVYGDHRLWPLLYLANPQAVDYAYHKNRLPYVILEPGTRLHMPDPAEARQLLAAGTPEGLWVVQFSANRNLRYALSFAARLEAPEKSVYVMENPSPDGRIWYLVRMGFFGSKKEAVATAAEVAARSKHSQYLVRPASAREIQRYLPLQARARG